MSNTPRILFAGDFCPHLRTEELIRNGRTSELFDGLGDVLTQNDLNVLDLECPLTTSSHKIPKTGPHLKASPEAIKALQLAKVDLVALANNHIMDYGPEGLRETMVNCASAGIATVGAGSTIDDACKPFSRLIHGKRIAMLNITENEWSTTTTMDPGANPLDLASNYYSITSAKASHDAVIVVFHGGNEFYELPSPRLKKLFRFFVDIGASAVVAHHTHIISGFEVYHGAPIYYGLGNFCFDWPGHRNSFWNKGMAVRFSIGNTLTAELFPFIQNDDKPGLRLLSDKERGQFDANLERLNAIIADDAQLSDRFAKFCKQKAPIYNIYLEPYRNPWLASLRKRSWIPSLFSKQKKRLILNITRCESHRDVFMKYLEE